MLKTKNNMPKIKDDNVQWFQAEFKTLKFNESKSYESGEEQVGTVIKGYASTPTLDRYNDVVEPSAFRESIKKNYKKNPIILFQHKDDRPIGKATFMSIDEKGLYIEAMIVDDEIEPKIKAGILKTFSIGYLPLKTAYFDGEGNELDPTSAEDRQKIWFDSDVKRVIKKVDLVENSIVSVPANPDAVFTLAKSVKSFFNNESKKLEELYNLKNNNMKAKNLLNEEIKEIKEVEEIKETEEVEEIEETPKEVIVTPSDETSGEVEDDETNINEEEEAAAETPKDIEAGLDASLVTAKNLTAALTAVVAKDARIRKLESQLKNLNEAPSKQALVYQEHGLRVSSDNKKTNEPTEKKGFKDALIASVQ